MLRCALNIIRAGANIISGALAPLCGSEPVCLDSGFNSVLQNGVSHGVYFTQAKAGLFHRKIQYGENNPPFSWKAFFK